MLYPTPTPPRFQHSCDGQSPASHTNGAPDKGTQLAFRATRSEGESMSPKDTCQLLGDRSQWINSQPPHPLQDNSEVFSTLFFIKSPVALDPAPSSRTSSLTPPFLSVLPPLFCFPCSSNTFPSQLPNQQPAPMSLSRALVREKPKLRV